MIREVQVRRYSLVSWIALALGVICFSSVFGEWMHVFRGTFYGGLILGISSLAGFILSAAGLFRRSEKKALLWLALVLSFTPFLYKLAIFIGFMTGWIPFAP
ncbi:MULTISPECIES: hypothetical protein [Paenibacillus]|uniref:Uncharacterized protein n=1 Tax=Paenibacillus albilobatus TaxID=2716884 RepID=A0A919XI09_9BACL|nr:MULTISPECIES: hypothetical protein [Paenibacillus]GIO32566.1 hypothetical protein J2TS6_37070 [Paenibacillus albilobatus]